MATTVMFLICFSVFVALLTAYFTRSRTPKKLPPSPWKLPIIGHMHHLALAGGTPHHGLRKLSKKYGDLMYLQLGEIPTVVVSSPRLAKEILRTQDLAFASRPELLFAKIMFHSATDVLCSPYGDYWRQMRKICTMELFTAKRVQSFGWIRQDEGLHLVRSIKDHLLSTDTPVNLTQKLRSYNSSMVMRAALGDFSKDHHNEFLQLIAEVASFITSFEISDLFPSLKILHPFLSVKSKMIKVQSSVDRVLDKIIDQHMVGRSCVDSGEDLIDVLLRIKNSSELQMPMTNNNIKAVLMDVFMGGTETSSSTVEWAMSELIRHPSVMVKAQNEIRKVLREDKTDIQESEIQELKYLKLVVKETLRLHPPGPLLFPRESRQQCEIDGYNIPAKTRVMVNVWAIARNSEYWDDPDSFKPERFENSSVDFSGSHFEFLPFGAGKRMCPGMGFGLANVCLPLALLLYHFDWELPSGLNPNLFDMTESVGISASRATDLLLLPKASTNILL